MTIPLICFAVVGLIGSMISFIFSFMSLRDIDKKLRKIKDIEKRLDRKEDDINRLSDMYSVTHSARIKEFLLLLNLFEKERRSRGEMTQTEVVSLIGV